MKCISPPSQKKKKLGTLFLLQRLSYIESHNQNNQKPSFLTQCRFTVIIKVVAHDSLHLLVFSGGSSLTDLPAIVNNLNLHRCTYGGGGGGGGG